MEKATQLVRSPGRRLHHHVPDPGQQSPEHTEPADAVPTPRHELWSGSPCPKTA